MNHPPMSDEDRLEISAAESYRLIADVLAKYACMDSLIQLKRFIKDLRAQRRATFTFRGQTMGYHVFPFIADMIVRHCTTFLVPRARMDENRFAWLIDKYVNFPDPLLLPNAAANLDKHVPEWFIRSAFEQLSRQEGNRSLVPRVLYLYDIIPKRDPSRHGKFIQTRDQVFGRQFRVSLHDLLLCTSALAAISSRADLLSDTLDTDIEWMKDRLQSDAMPIIRSQLTLTRDQYIEKFNVSFDQKYAYIKTTAPVIQWYPIVQFGQGCIVPDPHYLLDRVTRLLDNSFFQFHEDNDILQDYTGTFGEVFKEYIGQLLKECFGDENVIDLDCIGNLSLRRADWLVLSGRAAAIVECKSMRYPKLLKKTGDLNILTAFLDNNLAPALEQLEQTEQQWESIALQVPLARQVEEFYRFVVVQEHLEFVNRLSDFLTNSDTVRRCWETNTHIFSVLDLETAVMSNYAHDFRALFVAQVTSNPERIALDTRIRKLPGFQFTGDNFLDRKLNEYFHRE